MNETGKYTVSLGDRSQGTVIGDGNIVYQHYYASPIEAPTPVAPFPPSGFVGHDEMLGQLSSLLQSSTHAASVGLWGMAGVGKSTLAKALVQQIGERFPDGCLWGDARRAQGDVRTILEGFAWSLGQDPRMCPSFSLLRDRVRSLLRNRRMLLVLDNVSTHSEADAVSEVADPGQSVVLVTTRSRELAVDLAETVTEVAPLAPWDTEQLLRYHGQLTADVNLNELVTRTAGIPLLIEAVGRQIRRARPERKSDVISRLGRELLSPAHQLALTAGDIAYQDVLTLNYAVAPVESQRALRLMGILSPQPVSVETLSTILNLTPRKTEETIDALLDLALLEQADTTTYRLSGVAYALAADLARSAPDADLLFSSAVAHFRAWAEQHLGDKPSDDLQAQSAHFMALFELALDRQAWDTLGCLTDIVQRPTLVTGNLQVVYNTSWPLAQLGVTLKDSYLDQVNLRGTVAGDLFIHNAWLREVRLAGSRLGDIHARDSTFSTIDMRGVQAGDVHLRGSNVDKLDLRGAQLGDMYLRDCRITQALLDDASAGDIHLSGCVVAETDCSQFERGQMFSDDFLFINVEGIDSADSQE